MNGFLTRLKCILLAGLFMVSRFVSLTFVRSFFSSDRYCFLIMAWIAIFIIFLSSLPFFFFFFLFWRIGFKRRNRSRNYCSNRGMLGKIFFVLSVYYRSIIIFFFSVLRWFLMCLLRNSLWFIGFIIRT